MATLFFRVTDGYQYPWEQVVFAHFFKYPHKYNVDVIRTEITHMDKNKDGHLVIHRLVETKQHVPPWLAAIIGLQHMFFHEESVIDGVGKCMHYAVKNISLKKLVSFTEVCRYRGHVHEGARHDVHSTAPQTVRTIPARVPDGPWTHATLPSGTRPGDSVMMVMHSRHMPLDQVLSYLNTPEARERIARAVQTCAVHELEHHDVDHPIPPSKVLPTLRNPLQRLQGQHGVVDHFDGKEGVTSLVQGASVFIRARVPLKGRIEEFCLKRFIKKVGIGRHCMQDVLHALFGRTWRAHGQPDMNERSS